MSGIGEASLVIGMISSIISIIEAVKEVYDAVDDDSGLPKNFKKSAAKLPLIARLLEDAETYVKSANNDTQTAFMPTLKNCQQQAEKLQGLFSKVMPEDNDSRAERYLKAARTIGKGGRVETLTKGILEDLQLMATKFPAITPPKKKQELEKAIEEVSKMEPSLPDGFEENHGFAHYGSGAQNNNTGSGIQHNNSGAGNQNSGSGQQYIGTNHIDNADDLTQFKPRYTSDASKKSSSLYDFIPRGKNGKILWTSCDRKIQAGLLKIKEGIHIDNMQMEEAKELLGELSGCDITQDPIAVEKLIDLLDRFPLAILQAATYMSRTSISVTEYSRMFEKEDERWKLFENLDLDAPEAPKSVLQTLQISIDYIRRANLLSFKILHTISYFNSQSIQFELIKAAIRSPDNAKEGSINTSAFFTTVAFAILPVAVLAMAVPYANFDLLGNESKGDGNEGDGNDKDVLEAVARLEEFSMLQKEDGKRWYNMHKLVQEGTRYTIRQLKSKHNYERLHFSKTALNILLRSFPDSSQNTWATCEALLPHALAISSWSELSQEQISVADLLNKVSNYFADQHRWEEKESIDLKILKLRTQRLGAKNPYTILGIGQLSNTYKQQDRLNEAGRLRLEMLKLMREVLSERNSNTIWSIVILASIYHKQDHLNEAEKMYMETLESELKRMAEKHKKELKELKEQLKKAINDKNKDNIGALKKEFDKVKREGNKYQKAFAALKEEDKYREALLAWRDAEIAETSMLQRDERADKFLKALIARKDLEFSSLQTEKNDGSLADNDGDAPLIQASSNGNIEVVRSLLDKGADISVTNKDGWTPLYIASSNGHLEVVKFLLEKDADLSIGDNIRCTPLIAASGYGHLEIVKLLLERGADLSIATNNGWTPLNAASSHGHLEIVKLLLERGADLSIATNDGWTPLNAASSHGHLEIVKLLLERGADLSIATNNGWTPLNIASYSGHLEVVKLLLENTQVDTTKRDNNGRTAFFYAAMRGHHELVQLLLARSPLELYTHDCYNVTPLLAAVRNGHEKVAELLLAADEICIHSIDCFGRTLMCSAKRSRNTQLIQLIHHYATRAGLQIDDIDTSKQSELVPFDLSLAWCDICTSCIRDDSDYYVCRVCDSGGFCICLECFEFGAKCQHIWHLVRRQAKARR
ncbi:hypothetical protein ACMFMF_006974 [Clarireedia jacksonii]